MRIQVQLISLLTIQFSMKGKKILPALLFICIHMLLIIRHVLALFSLTGMVVDHSPSPTSSTESPSAFPLNMSFSRLDFFPHNVFFIFTFHSFTHKQTKFDLYLYRKDFHVLRLLKCTSRLCSASTSFCYAMLLNELIVDVRTFMII